MKLLRLIPWAILVATVVIALVWWGHGPADEPRAGSATPTTGPAIPLRIGLVPEQDVFVLRRSYQVLADYVASKLGRPVELATLNSYDGVLDDFREGKIDAAFLGSLVAVLAMDEFNARVLVKPRSSEGISAYRGVIFVRDGSPIRSVDELGGKSIAMLKTTTAGSVFPLAELTRNGILAKSPPRIVWMGTHDDVVAAVMSGQVDVGAAKDLRLDAYQKAHPELAIRRLATSPPVPNNAMVVQAQMAPELARRLVSILTEMGSDPEGRRALQAIGAEAFVPCGAEEYGPVYDMIDVLGSAWEQAGASRPAPKRPAARQGERP